MSEINKADIGPPGKLKRERLKSWFSLALGAHLLEGEYFSLGKILPELFGFHILQIGALCEREFLEDSCISHKVLIQLQEELLSPAAALQCLADNLPIMSDSIDVVVLPHSLEFLDSPHRLLREIERILIGEGHLIIIGFNPWSLCGLWRLFLAWRDEPPWNGHFYGMARIKDWLSLLDFELIKTDKFFYRPPLQNDRIMLKLQFLEKLGKFFWPYFGSVQVIVAKKRVMPLTPIKLSRKDRRSVIASSGIAEPTTRNQKS